MDVYTNRSTFQTTIRRRPPIQLERLHIRHWTSTRHRWQTAERLAVTSSARLSLHPKFYWFDAGVFRSVRPPGPLDRPEEIDRGALEGLVGQHLRAWMDYSRRRADLYFWRTKSGNEVDFIVYGEDGLWAFEVQNSATVRNRDLRGLRAFRED